MICCATLINSSFLLYYIRDIPWQTRHQLITENIRLRWRKVTKCYKEQVKMKKKELQLWVMVVTIFAYVLGQYFPLYLQTFVEIRNQKHTSRNDPTRKIHYLLLFFIYPLTYCNAPIISGTYWEARNQHSPHRYNRSFNEAASVSRV